MKKKTIIVLTALAFVSSLFLMTSCAKRQIGVGEDKSAGQKKATVTESKKAADTGYDEREKARQAELDRLAKLQREIDAFEAENIYFDFDRSELKPAAQNILKKKADWLRQNPEFSVIISGHCDERGTNEYNLALGERRANAAMKFLNALGIAADRLRQISYGEEKPVAPGHNEAAWAKNRRDEFNLMK